MPLPYPFPQKTTKGKMFTVVLLNNPEYANLTGKS